MYTKSGDDMNINDILPIGSIILLNRARKPLMIIGYFANISEFEKKDYLAVPYPEGLVNMNVLRAFNHKDIRSIIQMGNVGNSFLEFKDMLLNNDKINDILKEIK